MNQPMTQPVIQPVIRIVHLSDLHFGAAAQGLVQQLSRQVQALAPDLTVISGDLTQRARRDEFEQAADFVKTLPGAHLLIPGNHDLATLRLHERLLYPWHKWKRYLASELEPVLQQPGFVAMGLNTARRASLHADWSRGRINERQILRVENCLAEASPLQVRIVATHHPFFLTDEALHRGLVGRFAQAWPRFRAAGVDLLLSGHLHLAYARAFEGMVVAQASTGISHRLKGEPNGFNLISASRERIDVRQWSWQGQAYAEAGQQCFVQGKNGFEATAPEASQRVN